MDPAKILIWNVRGLNSTARQDSVHTLVQSIRADVVCLQETKMESISQWLVLSMLGPEFCHLIISRWCRLLVLVEGSLLHGGKTLALLEALGWTLIALRFNSSRLTANLGG